MRVHYIVPSILVTIACIGALLTTGIPFEAAPPVIHPDHRLHAGAHEHHAAGAAVHGELALHDAAAYAGRHLGHATVDAATLVGDPAWTPDWELHFIDTTHNGAVVHLSHATHKRHDEYRYVSHWNEEHGFWSEWELAP